MLLVIALYILAFVLFVLLVLYPTGTIILKSQENIVIRINTGIVAMAVIYFILALLKLNFLIIPVLLCPLAYLVAKREFKVPRLKIDLLAAIVIILVTLIQSSINFTSGDIVNGGIRLINTHNQDSMWMIALTQSVEREIPPHNPGLPQALIQNYHYFLNVFIAAAQTFTRIPLVTLYLKIIGPFLLFMLALTSYNFIKNFTGSSWGGICIILLTSLSSNLYYLVGLISTKANLTPSVFWVNEYETHIVNYQLTLSYIILLTFLHLLTLKKRPLLILGILGGSLVAFKSFSSVVLIPSLGLLGLLDLLKRNYFYIKLTLITTLFTILFYLTSNPTLQSQFIVQPLYLIQTMFVTSDHINYPDWILKIQTYMAEGNIKRVIQFYSEGVLLFIVGNLGLRLVGFASFLKNSVTKILGFISIFGLILTFLLVSKGIAWNSVQFTYYSVFATSILLTLYLKELSIKHRTLAAALFFTAWLSLIPGVLFITNSYLSQLGKRIVNQKIYQASIYLSKLPKGIVEVDPKYSQSLFVAAVSGQETYIADTGMLDIQLINYKNEKPENIKYILSVKEDTILIYQPGNPSINKVVTY